VLTCLSMLSTYYGHPVLPHTLNAELVAVNGFANTNLMIWEKLTEVYPDIKWDGRIDCPDTPTPLSTIDQYLNAGKPVIACVDFDPKEGLQQHFVLIIGKDTDYFINDPWTGETYFFTAKYGDPAKGIMGLRLYSGPVEVAPPVESPTEPYTGLSERMAKLEIAQDKTTDELSRNTRRLDEIQRSVDVVSADRAILEDLQAKMTELKEIVKMNSENLLATKKELRMSFDECGDDGQPSQTIGKLPNSEAGSFKVLLKLGDFIFGRRG